MAIYGVNPFWEDLLELRRPTNPLVPPLRDMPDFAAHRATTRCWLTLSVLGWNTREALLAGEAIEVMRAPNAGRTTWGEVARLRAALMGPAPLPARPGQIEWDMRWR